MCSFQGVGVVLMKRMIVFFCQTSDLLYYMYSLQIDFKQVEWRILPLLLLRSNKYQGHYYMYICCAICYILMGYEKSEGIHNFSFQHNMEESMDLKFKIITITCQFHIFYLVLYIPLDIIFFSGESLLIKLISISINVLFSNKLYMYC